MTDEKTTVEETKPTSKNYFAGIQQKLKIFVVKYKVILAIIVIILLGVSVLVYLGKIPNPLAEKMLVDQPRTDPQADPHDDPSADWSMRDELKKLEKHQQNLLKKITS